MNNQWHFIDPNLVNPEIFGMARLFAVKVKKHDYSGDVRNVSIEGWITMAEMRDQCPITGQALPYSQWFVFAAKGEEVEV